MDQTVYTTIDKKIRSGLVHLVLSYSYAIFLIAVIIGILLDMAVPLSFLSSPVYPYIGFAQILVGTAIVYWAQTASRGGRIAQAGNLTERNFERGPYKYTRNPTHLGLAISHLGLALTLGSVFSVVCIIIASVITKFVFIKKQEKILEQRYGAPYKAYKKKVRTWV